MALCELRGSAFKSFRCCFKGNAVRIDGRLLWFDGLAGLVAGTLMLSLCVPLGRLYDVPVGFILFLASANFLYPIYSLWLARHPSRTTGQVVALAAANIAWGIVCFACVFVIGSISIWGQAHLVFEGLFVGGLGIVEWLFRSSLVTVSGKA